jgi:CRP-like cAMP-binding protein
MTQEYTDKICNRITVLKAASAASRAALHSAITVTSYKRGEYLFHDKDSTRQIFAVLSGIIFLYKLNANGEKRSVFVYGPGAILNDESIDGKPESTNCDILKDAEIVSIERDVFFKTLSEDAALSRAFMGSMALKMRRLYHLMKNTSGNLRGDKRIAARLWKLSRDFGIPVELGTEINFDLTITFLADLLGAQRETVSRQAKALSNEGLIIVKNGRFIIPDREKLKNYCVM